MFHLVMQSFGKETEYRRAVFAVLSLYAHLPKNTSVSIILFTDKPEFFKDLLAGLDVRYVLLTATKIRQMRGEIDFLHRMKIALIEEAFGEVDGPVLYADSDTFFIQDPTVFISRLSPDRSFMHVREYQFESLRHMPLPAGETFQAFLRLIESQSFTLPDQRKINITAQHSSWNAGVMIFHPAHKRFIPDVYALTDQFYPSTKNHASEQYAFSVVLQEHTLLEPCDQVIYHYWHRVKKEIIDRFLASLMTQHWQRLTLETRVGEIRNHTTSMPRIFEEHVLTLKDNSIQAFNANDFSKGYRWALKAFGKGAYADTRFIKDVLYHFKRQLTSSGKSPY